MKKTISVTIESLDNKDLRKIQEAKQAIRVLSDLAKDMKKEEMGYKVNTLEATAYSGRKKEDTPAFAYFVMTVDIEGMEEILGKISKTVDELEVELRELTEKIYMGIEKETPQK